MLFVIVFFPIIYDNIVMITFGGHFINVSSVISFFPMSEFDNGNGDWQPIIGFHIVCQIFRSIFSAFAGVINFTAGWSIMIINIATAALGNKRRKIAAIWRIGI